MSALLAVWWWLHPDFMAIAAVVVSSLTLIVAWWIASEQKKIAKRMAAMAETQHRVWQEQIERRPDIRVTAEGPYFENEKTTDFKMYLYAENVGRSAASKVTSMAALGGKVHRGQVNIYGYGEEKIEASGQDIDGETHMTVSVKKPFLIYPGQRPIIAYVDIIGPMIPFTFHVLWRIHTDIGSFPATENGRIDFECFANGQVAIKASGSTVTIRRDRLPRPGLDSRTN